MIGLAKGETFTSIANRIGKATSAVSREVGANGGRHAYRASGGHRRAQYQTRHPKPAKMASCPALWPRSSKASDSSRPPRRSPGACTSSTLTIR